MTIPLWILAFLAIVGGFLGLPGVIANGELNWIHHWLGAPYGGPVAEPATVPHGEGFLAIEWALLGLGALIGIGGVWFAWTRYTRHGLAYDETLRKRFGKLYGVWQGKYFVDEAYDKSVVKPIINGSYRILNPFDKYVVDGTVNAVAIVTRGVGSLLRYVQTGVVQNYAVAIVIGMILVVGLILFS